MLKFSTKGISELSLEETSSLDISLDIVRGSMSSEVGLRLVISEVDYEDIPLLRVSSGALPHHGFHQVA